MMLMKKLSVIATLLSSLFLMQVITINGDVGTATAYGPPYIPTMCDGSSQSQFPPSNMFAAVSEGLWDNGAACGRMYEMRCLSGNNRPCKEGTIIVVVVDQCTRDPCPASILLSNEAFSAISHIAGTRINIEFMQI